VLAAPGDPRGTLARHRGAVADTIGIALWLVYGLALMDWPLITSDAVTLALMAVIVTMKVRYG
jgi:MtN3 and saliva related transmembrane protein